MERLTLSQANKIANDLLKTCRSNKTGEILWDMGWRFVVDARAKRRAGQCRYTKKQVAISEWALLGGFSKEKAEDTIRHEIAHAIDDENVQKYCPIKGKWVKVDKPHGRKWVAACKITGANPKARYSAADRLVYEEKKYKIFCKCEDNQDGNKHGTNRMCKRVRLASQYYCQTCSHSLARTPEGVKPRKKREKQEFTLEDIFNFG